MSDVHEHNCKSDWAELSHVADQRSALVEAMISTALRELATGESARCIVCYSIGRHPILCRVYMPTHCACRCPAGWLDATTYVINIPAPPNTYVNDIIL